MFTIFHKNVGGRIMERYFQTWENAKNAMTKEEEECGRFGWIITKKQNFFNAEKGFYIYQIDGRTNEGEPFTFSLLDGYFED